MTDRPTPTGAPTEEPRSHSVEWIDASRDEPPENGYWRCRCGVTFAPDGVDSGIAHGWAEARASASLDEQKVRALFREMWHESTHPGDGVAESCITCIRKADDLIEYARLSEQPGGEK